LGVFYTLWGYNKKIPGPLHSGYSGGKNESRVKPAWPG